jgi:transposase
MHEMPCVAADLSSLDRETLRALVLAQQEKLLSRDSEIEHLKLIIAKLRRMMFGTKSEKITREIEQLELKLEELEVRKAERAEARPGSEPPRQRPSRQPLPEHLPREVHVHMPDADTCTACGGGLSKLGEDLSEMLEYVPASFKVIRHIRPKLCCTKCDMILEARRRRGRSSADSPGQVCWRMCWLRSTRITFRSIGSRRSMRVKASILIARRLLIGSDYLAIY